MREKPAESHKSAAIQQIQPLRNIRGNSESPPARSLRLLPLFADVVSSLQNLQIAGDSPHSNVFALVKDDHRFVFLYDDLSDSELLQQLGEMASDPELPQFTWYDAALLSQKLRRERRDQQRAREDFHADH